MGTYFDAKGLIMMTDLKQATPEDRVIHLAKLWREADKTATATKDPGDASKEYRLRQELRGAVDKLK